MIRRSLLAGAVALLVVPALAGCEAGLNAPTLEFHPASSGAHKIVDGLTISNVFVLAAPSGASLPPGSRAGMFLGLYNNGSSSDKLIGVTLPHGGAASVTIAGGSVTVPGNSGVNLTGPSPKIVLNGLSAPLSGGQAIDVTLIFQKAGQANLDVPVEPQSYYYASLSQPSASATPPAATPSTKASVTPATPSAPATPTPTQ
ncbi:MAG TPA: copper chaperone PCu(A)C [Trebonia sp.]|nr:copper chaperone PCu(A)C [Trebonia sp.]